MPKIRRRFNYWKPLHLPLLSKSRVIEIFLASPLWYATSFYPIPPNIEKELDKLILEFAIFPKKKNEVSKMEMQKLKLNGGIKLIQTKLKSLAPKIKWLIDLVTDESLKTHRNVFRKIIGKQKYHIEGENVIYSDEEFMKKYLKLQNGFYHEALKGISKLNLKKHTTDINKETLFHNKNFTSNDEETGEEKSIKPFKSKNLQYITTYGDLIQAKSQNDPFVKALVEQKLKTIHKIWVCYANQIFLGSDNEPIELKNVTQKCIYNELIHKQSKDHIHQSKWIVDRGDEVGVIEWNNVWESLHNHFYADTIKTTIWEQIHLNFYTTYNYNKWHNSMQNCPLCNEIPNEIFHIILDCKFVIKMWKKIESTLLKITPRQITPYELAFGIQNTNKTDKNAVILRNYLTFTLRHCIMNEERKAYYKPYNTDDEKFMTMYNNRIAEEIETMSALFQHLGKSNTYEKIISINEAIVTKTQGHYETKCIME